MIVELVVGQDDAVVLPEYSVAYEAVLRHQEVDVRSSILPGLGHTILLEPEVIEKTIEIVSRL